MNKLNRKLHILPLLLTALISTLVITFKPPATALTEPKSAPVAHAQAVVDIQPVLVPETQPEAPKFNAEDPKTWPDCKDDEFVRADNGQCAKKPPVASTQTAPRASTTSKYPIGCENYRSIVAQYDWNVSTMMRIMSAESGCNPTNHNWTDNHRTCKGSFGLFQIGCVHGYSVAYLSDPANNIAAAYKIWKSSGYTAWTTY